MRIVDKKGVWKLFEKSTALIMTDEKQLETIVKSPELPLFDKDDRGFSGESQAMYKSSTSLRDLCEEGQKDGAERMEVSYDFFFGGTKRDNYPDSEITVKAFKVIHEEAKKHGMSFSASVISPLDIGGGYAKKYAETGFTHQFLEGAIQKDGSYCVDMVLQKQWYNNKGPIRLLLEKVRVFAFNEEKLDGTAYYYVDPEKIAEITDTESHKETAEEVVTGAGYGSSRIRIEGKITNTGAYNRCLVVLIYRTPELDYFKSDIYDYIKGVIDEHNANGITYQGFYSDEMHIQFDWDLGNHFGETEINTRYITDNLQKEYAGRFGSQYKDLDKYLVYFSYHQHDFLEGEAGQEPSQHVWGKDDKAVYETWLFRKRYFEMLQDRVVDLSIRIKKYAEQLFNNPIMTRAHATWQESPTCDHFYKRMGFSKSTEGETSKWSRYDYTKYYDWSSSIRENVSACYDYFKWNDFLTGSGNDHPEGGNIDRNYYAQALACSFGVLNEYPYAYCGYWGSPKEVLRRLSDVGVSYGNSGWEMNRHHNMVQGVTHRLTDVLMMYPIELNYVEERFGSWTVQYGYCNYITEGKLIQYGQVTDRGTLQVKDREYKALVVLFEPYVMQETLDLMKEFVNKGGKVIWTAIPPVMLENGQEIGSQWLDLFGLKSVGSAWNPLDGNEKKVSFKGLLKDVADMEIQTALLVDKIYPVEESDGQVTAGTCCNKLGVAKQYPNGGVAVYLGFRPRDDQSQSLGEDVSTLFSVLKACGAYEEQGTEVLSRPASSKYVYNRFDNGAISVANHYRTFEEKWPGQFYRDDAKDAEYLAGRVLPPVDITFNGESLFGHSISYKGIDVLTYNVQDGKLTGFAGCDTTGITVDGKEYRFVDQPMDLAFTRFEKHYLNEGIEDAWYVMASKPGTMHLPLCECGFGSYQVEACQEDFYATDWQVAHQWTEQGLDLTITEREAGKWIIVYKAK